MNQITNISPVIIISSLTIFVDLILGAVVYVNNRKSATNVIFTLLNAVTIFWILCNLLGTFLPDLSQKLFWIRMVMFAAVGLGYLFYLLATTFPEEKISISLIDWIFSLSITIIAMVLSITPFVFSGIGSVGADGIPSPTVGAGIAVFGVVVFYFVFIGIYRLFKKYKRSEGVKKNQLRFLLEGTAAMFILFLIFNFLLVAVFNITTQINFSSIFVSIFIVLTSYSIIKHGLFNAKVVATQLFVFSLWIFVLIRTLFSASMQDWAINIGLLVMLVVIGILLIRSILKEVLLSEEKSEFMSFASHEIRTPMTVMKGYAAMVLEGDLGRINPKVKDAAQKILISSNNVLSLIAQYLSKSKNELGQLSYSSVVFDLGKMVKELVQNFQINAEQKGIKLTAEVDDKLTYDVKADEGKIREVIGNLIDNAVKYTPKEGLAVVSVIKKDGKILVKIADTGSGIPKETIPQLFKKFSRADAQKANLLGTGLGLFLSKTFIDAHKGRIWVESEGENKGSQFYVELPHA